MMASLRQRSAVAATVLAPITMVAMMATTARAQDSATDLETLDRALFYYCVWLGVGAYQTLPSDEARVVADVRVTYDRAASVESFPRIAKLPAMAWAEDGAPEAWRSPFDVDVTLKNRELTLWSDWSAGSGYGHALTYLYDNRVEHVGRVVIALTFVGEAGNVYQGYNLGLTGRMQGEVYHPEGFSGNVTLDDWQRLISACTAARQRFLTGLSERRPSTTDRYEVESEAKAQALMDLAQICCEAGTARQPLRVEGRALVGETSKLQYLDSYLEIGRELCERGIGSRTPSSGD